MSTSDVRTAQSRLSLVFDRYLLNVKQQQEFENLHGRQERSEQNAQPGKNKIKKSSHYPKTAAIKITLKRVAGLLPCQRLSIDEFKDVPGDIKHRFPVPLEDTLRKQPARNSASNQTHGG